jgi:multicomponent Na+:H+ antiporter subunit G
MTGAILDWLTMLLALAGAAFFFAGALGVLRFPTTYLRLHAATKADNLGLGFIVLALMLQAGSLPAAGKLLLIWLLALLATSNTGFMIGRWTRRHEAKKEGARDGA